MGLYINPKTFHRTKESWLVTYGSQLTGIPTQYKVGDEYVVCLINNGGFTAAGVCYSQKELVEFTNPSDTRTKHFFLVKEDDLRDVCGESFDMYVELGQDQ